MGWASHISPQFPPRDQRLWSEPTSRLLWVSAIWNRLLCNILSTTCFNNYWIVSAPITEPNNPSFVASLSVGELGEELGCHGLQGILTECSFGGIWLALFRWGTQLAIWTTELVYVPTSGQQFQHLGHTQWYVLGVLSGSMEACGFAWGRTMCVLRSTCRRSPRKIFNMNGQPDNGRDAVAPSIRLLSLHFAPSTVLYGGCGIAA